MTNTPRGPVGKTCSIVTIGLDGATLDLLVPLMEQDIMPNLRSLVESGSHGRLYTTIPAITAPAWASFFTGKNPGKHGVYDFWGPLRGTSKRTINDWTSIRGPAIWDIAARYGKSVGLINLPMSYPVPKVNGFAVSGMGTVRQDETFVYPPELLSEVNAASGYIPDMQGGRYAEEGEIHSFLDGLLHMTRQRIELGIKLIRANPVDIFMLVFVTTDRIQHILWHILDPDHPLHDENEAREYLPKIHECYRLVDEGLGRLVAAAEPEVATIVMSDHGFGPLKTHFDLEAWLRATGFLRYKLGMATVRRILNWTQADTMLFKGFSLLQPQLATTGTEAMVDSMLDWKRSRAYRDGAHGLGLSLNRRGREPLGIVDPGAEYQEVREALVSELRDLRDPATGQKVVDEIFRAEEIHFGPCSPFSPDILFTPAVGYKAGRRYYSSRLFWPAERRGIGTGWHRRDGMVVMSGKAVSRKTHLISAEIQDVAPTILYLLGLPVPDDMDGRVLTECIEPSVLDSNQLQIVDAGTQDAPSVLPGTT